MTKIRQLSKALTDFVVDEYRERLQQDESLPEPLTPLAAEEAFHVKNTGDDDVPAYELISIADQGSSVDDRMVVPTYDGNEPIFPDDIEHAFPVPALLEADADLIVSRTHFQVAKLSERVQADDQWVMLDPDNPTKYRSADAGTARIVQYDAAKNLAKIDHTDKPSGCGDTS